MVQMALEMVGSVVQMQSETNAVCKELYDLIKEERNIAISQLNDYGVRFGEKADCVRVVRCKDCIHAHSHDDKNSDIKFVMCLFHAMSKNKNDYCSYGEKRDGKK